MALNECDFNPKREKDHDGSSGGNSDGDTIVISPEVYCKRNQSQRFSHSHL